MELHIDKQRSISFGNLRVGTSFLIFCRGNALLFEPLTSWLYQEVSRP